MFFVFALCLFPSTALGLQNAGAPQIWELPRSGPPTTYVLLQGGGFDPLTAIDIYFDSTKLASTTTDKNGSFGNGVITATGPTFIRIQVPVTALPGEHTITAQQRVGQKSAQLPFLVQTDWPQFGFDPQRTALNPYENVLGPDNVDQLTVRWSSNVGPSSPPPVIAGGMVYDPCSYSLCALDAATGDLIWTYETGDTGFSSPTVANRVVYMGSGGNNNPRPGLYALDATTGALLWYYAESPGPYNSSPLVANGLVYFSDKAGDVHALNATTGALVWTYSAGSNVLSSLALANGVLYVAAFDGNVHALNAATGVLIWKHLLAGNIYASPSVADGMLYVGDSYPDWNFYALDATTGATVWKYPVAEYASSQAIANGVVYVIPNLGVIALDAKTGVRLWESSTGGAANAPVVANGVLYLSAQDESLYAFNAGTGALLWKYAFSKGSPSPPVVVNGLVYIGCYNLYAFGLPGGQVSDKFSPPERPDSARLTPNWSLQPNTAVTPAK